MLGRGAGVGLIDAGQPRGGAVELEPRRLQVTDGGAAGGVALGEAFGDVGDSRGGGCLRGDRSDREEAGDVGLVAGDRAWRKQCEVGRHLPACGLCAVRLVHQDGERPFLGRPGAAKVAQSRLQVGGAAQQVGLRPRQAVGPADLCDRAHQRALGARKVAGPHLQVRGLGFDEAAEPGGHVRVHLGQGVPGGLVFGRRAAVVAEGGPGGAGGIVGTRLQLGELLLGCHAPCDEQGRPLCGVGQVVASGGAGFEHDPLAVLARGMTIGDNLAQRFARQGRGLVRERHGALEVRIPGGAVGADPAIARQDRPADQEVDPQHAFVERGQLVVPLGQQGVSLLQRGVRLAEAGQGGEVESEVDAGGDHSGGAHHGLVGVCEVPVEVDGW